MRHTACLLLPVCNTFPLYSARCTAACSRVACQFVAGRSPDPGAWGDFASGAPAVAGGGATRLAPPSIGEAASDIEQLVAMVQHTHLPFVAMAKRVGCPELFCAAGICEG
eukprot:COSAG03_NODE_2900_length_2367_cov_1.255291_2_plen_110_part_00